MPWSRDTEGHGFLCHAINLELTQPAKALGSTMDFFCALIALEKGFSQRPSHIGKIKGDYCSGELQRELLLDLCEYLAWRSTRQRGTGTRRERCSTIPSLWCSVAPIRKWRA